MVILEKGKEPQKKKMLSLPNPWNPLRSFAALTQHAPQGPFHTKNAIAKEIVVLCCRSSVSPSVPIRSSFFPGKTALRSEPPFTASLRAFRAQKREKVTRRVFWGFRKKLKVPEKSRKIYQKVRKWVFLDFFGYFRGLSSNCGPPKRLFLRFFLRFWARRAWRLLL